MIILLNYHLYFKTNNERVYFEIVIMIYIINKIVEHHDYSASRYSRNKLVKYLT